jgi:hypothetical protein
MEIQEAAPKLLSWTRVGPNGFYRRDDGVFYYRYSLCRRRTFRSLGTTDAEIAAVRHAEMRAEVDRARMRRYSGVHRTVGAPHVHTVRTRGVAFKTYSALLPSKFGVGDRIYFEATSLRHAAGMAASCAAVLEGPVGNRRGR